MTLRGKFITLEGGEGVGKTTLQKGLIAAFANQSLEAVSTREPGGTPSAELIREILLAPPNGASWEPLSELLLFNVARNEHLEGVIRPALEQGRWVVCDRFVDSTRAYQNALQRDLNAAIERIQSLVVGHDIPDLTIILDAPLEYTKERLTARGGDKDAIETRTIDFHQRVRAEFQNIAQQEPDRCVLIDATKSAEEVLKAALQAIEGRLNVSTQSAAS